VTQQALSSNYKSLITQTQNFFYARNFFRTALRNLWKNKGYSFLNIFGLAIGIACAA
jgi:hypothetical protein